MSPKELFAAYNDEHLLIANIASPNSIANIRANPLVCVSFINVFKEKGYQLKGEAVVVPNASSDFKLLYQHLPLGDCSKFPIQDIIQVKIQSAKEIVSPSYWLFPETTEQSQVEQALKTYKVIADVF